MAVESTPRPTPTAPRLIEVAGGLVGQQATVNAKLIARADANGQFRLVENLRRVQDSLELIIPPLENLADEVSS
jgi:hypothetical protein